LERVFWLKIGNRNLHLLKLVGAFFLFAAILMVGQSTYAIFVQANKINYVLGSPSQIPALFGWSMGAPSAFLSEDIVGSLLEPIAAFLFWIGVAIIALMIYQSGKVVFPIEESEIAEHHRKLIQQALSKAKKR
jgi:hypothetical protein